MDARTYLRSLLEYNAWANAALYSKVRELPPEEVTKERRTLLHSIHVSLNHLLSVDMMWHAHMEKRRTVSASCVPFTMRRWMIYGRPVRKWIRSYSIISTG